MTMDDLMIDLDDSQALEKVEATPSTGGDSFLQKIDRGKHLIVLVDCSDSMRETLHGQYEPFGNSHMTIHRRSRRGYSTTTKQFTDRTKYGIVCKILQAIVDDRFTKHEHPLFSVGLFDSSMGAHKVLAKREEIVPAVENSATWGGTAVMSALNFAFDEIIPQVPNATYHHVLMVTDGDSNDISQFVNHDLSNQFGKMVYNSAFGVDQNIQTSQVAPFMDGTELMVWAKKAKTQKVKLDWVRIGKERFYYRDVDSTVGVDQLTTIDRYSSVQWMNLVLPIHTCKLLGGDYEVVDTEEGITKQLTEKATRLCLPPGR